MIIAGLIRTNSILNDPFELPSRTRAKKRKDSDHQHSCSGEIRWLNRAPEP